MKPSRVYQWLNFNHNFNTLLKLNPFQERCYFCHSHCDDPRMPLVCSGCFGDLPWLTHFCYQCAEPLPALSPDKLSNQQFTHPRICGRCLKKPPAFDRTLSPLKYELPINPLISQLKDRARHDVLELASFLFISRWREDISQNTPEYLIPVPLHRKRLYSRGYNQSLEWARYLSKNLNIPIAPKVAIRMSAAADQKGLNAKARRRNLKQAFSIDADFKAQHVALIDDVMTTGATFDALALELKRCGVERVEGWCLGRTPIRD